MEKEMSENKEIATGNKKSNFLRNLIIIVVVALLFYFILLKPYMTFKSNEKILKNAGIRYFDLNEDKLPTGKRVSTVTLQELSTSKYIQADFYEPFSKKLCSITKSWVKVKKEGNEFKYYTYLDCGVVSSTGVDHTGPVITLKNKQKMVVDRYSDFEDPGIESVIDDNDGKIDINDVSIKGKVDTDTTGDYELVYSVSDSLGNKTTLVRKITVVERIKDTVMKSTKDTGYYKGDPNNYVYFGANMYRIIGNDDNDNVKLISYTNVGNINYSALDKYLKKYYDSLPNESKKMIIDSKYCNGQIKDINVTECSSYSKEKKYSIPSVVDMNRAEDNGTNFILNGSITWSSNIVDNNNSYALRSFFFDSNDYVYRFSNDENYGVRPVITIKGTTLVKGGNGTKTNPYTFKEDVTPSKANVKVNERYAGEYLTIDNHLWRISEIQEDGTTKIIHDGDIYDEEKIVRVKDLAPIVTYEYNPKVKGNVGYYVNNKLSEFISTDYFEKHSISVPIYKNKAQYGKQSSIKKYDVKLSIPSIYDLYNVYNENDYNKNSYFLIDSFTEPYAMSFMTDMQTIVTINQASGEELRLGIRPVAYLTKNAYITFGSGTVEDPYKITRK